MIQDEQIPESVINSFLETEQNDDDVKNFHSNSVCNKMFGILKNKHLTCPNNHSSSMLQSCVGLNFKPSKSKNTLKKLLANHFKENYKLIDCSECKHSSKESSEE